ncbi:MAG: hypothetical protein EAY81_06965 [Bacteroidetes bacterium]|nr:MAG: hypothetical protein EAY81_06965 [Bacteroidota bacterium]
MSYTKAIYLALVIAAIVIFMYGILPRLKLNVNTAKVSRGIIFLAMMIYLGIDFYIKKQYWYLLILALGTIGFMLMLKDSRPKGDSNQHGQT